MKPIIEIKNLSKKYALGERQPYYSLRETISNVFKKPFSSYLLKKDEFWALKDISFKVNQGEVVGVIGPNGAGKSTLLKILCRITPPTTGEVLLRGRVGSLLEIGTGFHPELTGRENIYLNGAILGMKRWEINKKFNEIVEFAEIERFIDTPVKHYSSGMYMRLAFAIAAHLEPEILIIDEVLAVGDAEFQKKCLGKIDNIAKEDGRTVLFVSHSMAAINQLCKKTILLEKGRIKMIGETNKVINEYSSLTEKTVKEKILTSSDADISFNIVNKGKIVTNEIQCGKPLTFLIEIYPKRRVTGMRVVVAIFNSYGQRLLDFDTRYQTKDKQDISDYHKYLIKWNKNILCPGTYRVSLGLYENEEYLTGWENVDSLKVLESDYYLTGKLPNSGQGPILTDAEWIIK